LSDVFDEAIEFLHYYKNETVIMHLKDDNFNFNSTTEYRDTMHGTVHTVHIDGFGSYAEIYEAIGKLSINNTSYKIWKTIQRIFL